jgi:hypothetical protein
MGSGVFDSRLDFRPLYLRLSHLDPQAVVTLEGHQMLNFSQKVLADEKFSPLI